MQFDPQGLSPIIDNWFRKYVSTHFIFPASLQQVIIYFVLHFQFQVNNPCIQSKADLKKYEFRAWTNRPIFGTILFGKAFPSSVLFKYQCYVRIDKIGNGFGIGIVPKDFNTFLHEHEYFPHYKTNTCVVFENGHYFGWNGIKENTAFRMRTNDVLVIEMDMKKRTMSVSNFGEDMPSFVITKLPDDSKLAFVLDTADITITSQSWKL